MHDRGSVTVLSVSLMAALLVIGVIGIDSARIVSQQMRLTNDVENVAVLAAQAALRGDMACANVPYACFDSGRSVTVSAEGEVSIFGRQFTLHAVSEQGYGPREQGQMAS